VEDPQTYDAGESIAVQPPLKRCRLKFI